MTQWVRKHRKLQVETVDFSQKAKVYKYDGTDDFVEIDVTQDVVGRVKSTIQPV